MNKKNRVNPFKEADFCSPGRLVYIVVYDNPRDYPGQYVARLFEDGRPTAKHVTGDTLQQVRAYIPADLVAIQRDKLDDPCIVETWI